MNFAYKLLYWEVLRCEKEVIVPNVRDILMKLLYGLKMLSMNC
jgi:hypothetical protein